MCIHIINVAGIMLLPIIIIISCSNSVKWWFLLPGGD